jgi:hypothetical protein
MTVKGHSSVVDVKKLDKLLRSGKTKSECSRYFGVSPAAITKACRRIGKKKVAVVTIETAGKIVDQNLDAVAQLQKINGYANEMLDLLMRWQRGDDEALRILESQTRKVMIGKGENAVEVTEFKFKDPRELALKAMAEIRGQLGLQFEIFKSLYDMKIVAEFQESVLEAIREVSPEMRDAVITKLKERRALRQSVTLV